MKITTEQKKNVNNFLSRMKRKDMNDPNKIRAAYEAEQKLLIKLLEGRTDRAQKVIEAMCRETYRRIRSENSVPAGSALPHK